MSARRSVPTVTSQSRRRPYGAAGSVTSRYGQAGVVLAVVAAILIAVVLWAVVTRTTMQRGLDSDEEVRAAAVAGIETMVDVEPSEAATYVDRVLAATTGDQRTRVEQSRAQLNGVVTALEVPAVGRVLSAGVIDRDGETAQVVAVVAAGAPELIGAVDPRATLRIHLQRVDGHWLISGTEQLS